ncbi:MAG TPA: OmpA family protein [Edaphocola sp.]|nr:OmpA family protein [Edaphocola sp.]
MKKFILSIILLSLNFLSFGQEEPTKPINNFQFSIFGGPSFPLGDYGNFENKIGRAKPGLNLGVTLDYFFGKSNFGFGIDGRFQRHKMNPFITDSGVANSMVYGFSNGYTTFSQTEDAFSHIGIAAGPAYKINSGKFSTKLFARAGILMQQYINYRQDIVALNPFTNNYEIVYTPLQTVNNNNNPIAAMGLVGVNFAYNINPIVSIGLQADYLRAFGAQGEFSVASYEKYKTDIPGIRFNQDKGGIITTDIYNYYDKNKIIEKAVIQDFNIGLSLILNFGTKMQKSSGNVGGGAIGKNEKQTSKIIIQVKDKKTGLALGGVKIDITDANGAAYIGFTDANGIANTELKEGKYIVIGEKNFITTDMANISASEFKTGTIFKELYHDDERFTLSGETIDCETEKNLARVVTRLLKTSEGRIIEQISDAFGKFYYQLEPNTDYQVVALENGKYSQTELVTTKGLNRNKTLYVALKLGVCEMSLGKSFEVKNILYDFNDSKVRTDAVLVLNNLAEIMKRNANMKIELSSHTDSRGDNSYNLKLSQARADAVVKYLVSKGIQKNRLIAKGYGETRLKNKCKDGVSCTEEEHQQNRRTEIKVLQL